MDEHKGKQEEDKFLESTTEPQPRCHEADNSEEPMEHHHQAGGYDKEGRSAAEEEPWTVQVKEVETGCSDEEEASSPASLLDDVFANPCSLLQYLLRRACAGWCGWGLHGASFDGDDPKPQQAVAPDEAVAAPANATEQQQADDGGEKANYCYMQEEVVVTRVFALRRGRQPGGSPSVPRPGRGGNGGSHN